MIDRRQTFKNAVLTVAQVAISAACMFAVYRYMLRALGPGRMGVWSIVMAVSTAARLSDLGFAGGATKFVAKYRALDDSAAVARVIDTATLSLVAFVALIAAAIYPVTTFVLPNLFEGSRLADASILFPYSLASFCLLAIGGVFLSSLDGFQRADQRNAVLIAGTVVYAVLIPVCVSHFGFVGLGYAQLAQSLLILIAGRVLVVRAVPGCRLLPFHWSRLAFREMLGYNLNLQVVTFASFLGDPLTKLMLGRFGSLEMVGFYEMASKMVAQFRAILINVNQVLVPVIAHAHEKDKLAVKRLFEQTYAAVFLISMTFYGALAMSVPAISGIWLGSYNKFFMLGCYMLLLAMQLNTLVGPAYFSNLGTGKVRLNSGAQLVIAAFNICVSPVLGLIAGGMGIVVGYSAAVIAGALYLVVMFLRAEQYEAGILLSAPLRRPVAIGLAVIAVVSTGSYLTPELPVSVHLAFAVAGVIAVCLVLRRSVAALPFAALILKRLKPDA